MTGVAFVIITGRGNVRKKRILPLGLGAKKMRRITVYIMTPPIQQAYVSDIKHVIQPFLVWRARLPQSAKKKQKEIQQQSCKGRDELGNTHALVIAGLHHIITVSVRDE